MNGAATLDRSDVGRWLLSAAVVLGLHAAAVTVLLRHHQPVMGDEGGPAVIVDLSPFVTPPSESQQDLAPGPEQQFLPQPPAPPQEQKPEEEEKPKVEPPPPTRESEVTMPEEATPEPPKPVPDTPPPTPTAPPRQRTASAAAVTSWNISIAKQIERHKGYPASALRRRESGVTRLAFALDREGHVIERRVIQSSGYVALDQEAIATLDRAQPFPLPPEGLGGERFEFRVPVKFTVK